MRKYIRFEEIGIFTFDKKLQHSDVAKRFSEFKPISAGFTMYDRVSDKVVCFGDSMTLGIEAKEDDTEILYQQLTRHTA